MLVAPARGRRHHGPVQHRGARRKRAVDAGRHDARLWQHVRQRAQGPRRRAVQRADRAARHHRGISGARLDPAAPRANVRLQQLVARRSRGAELGRRAERRALRVLPGPRRLAIDIGGVTKVFDTGEHHIGGVQQQQGTGYSSVGFTSQLGTFGKPSLREVGTHQAAHAPAAAPPAAAAPSPGTSRSTSPARPPHLAPPTPVTPAAPAAKPASGCPEDRRAIVAAIESLAGLHGARHPLRRGVRHRRRPNCWGRL